MISYGVVHRENGVLSNTQGLHNRVQIRSVTWSGSDGSGGAYSCCSVGVLRVVSVNQTPG